MVLLTDMMMDLEEDGEWNDSLSRAKIAEWALTIDSPLPDSANGLAKIRENVEGWKLSTTGVPNFEKMIRRFYGLELQLGVCGDDVPMGTVKEVSNAKSTMYYAKDYFDSTITVARFKCLDDGRWRRLYITADLLLLEI